MATSRGWQKFMFLGNLGKDPEMSKTKADTPWCRFPVAINEVWMDTESVTWVTVNVYGNQAEACAKYLSTGRTVLVEGKLVSNEYGSPKIWTTQEGEARSSFEVRAKHVVFLDSGEKQAPSEDDAPFLF